jgi:hypothetical protein
MCGFIFVFGDMNAYANKTHFTDTQGQGNSRLEVSYTSGSGSANGTANFSGDSLTVESTITASQTLFSLYYGISDRIDIGISLPFSEKFSTSNDLSDGTDTLSIESGSEGMSDISFGASYLMLDKDGGDALDVQPYAIITLPTASDDEGESGYSSNGTSISDMKKGKAGSGATTIRVGFNVAHPLIESNLLFNFEYKMDGDKTKDGVTYTYGNDISFMIGNEYFVSDIDTVTLQAFYEISGSDETSEDTTSDSFYVMSLQGVFTHDVSSDISASAGFAFERSGETNVKYATGDTIGLRGNIYAFFVGLDYFF